MDIYNGNLKPYVDEILKNTLSESYYNQIKSRMVLINVLKRITQKVSKSYIKPPKRIVSDDRFLPDVEAYVTETGFNAVMQKSDSYLNLFKGYALEPYIIDGLPRIRVLPFDRFLPISESKIDPTKVTIFVKFMGKRSFKKAKGTVFLDVFHVYSETEFLSFNSEGEIIEEDMEENQGINPYGIIPVFYGFRSNDEIIPTQDTDTLALTKLIPVMLTDLAGAVMFQCFSVIYGIDIDPQNLKMSPNAFWLLKSDARSDKQPQIGTIKPEADVDKVIKYITDIFSLWLETRGIRIGSVGSLNSTNFASGISKLIDEIDASDLIQQQQLNFVSDEQDFWTIFGKIQNYWVTTNQLFAFKHRSGLWPEDLLVTPIFEKPVPLVDRRTQVETTKLEVDSGFLPRKEAIKQLYPDLTEEIIETWLKQIEAPIEISDGEMAEV
ncbi:MAG: hypothetical protein ABIM30_02795 [candidate division WOR-3 bacterium]